MASPFDEHGSTVVLDMMKSMSFLPGLGLGCRQHFTPLILFLHRPILGSIFPLHRSCVSHYQFDLPYCLIIDIIFTLGTLRFMVHELFYICFFLYTRAWVFYHWVFGPSFPFIFITLSP